VELGRRLPWLPERTQLELLAAPPEREQWYRGPIVGSSWRIEETYPALDALSFREGLAVAEAYSTKRPFALRDAAHAAALRDWLGGIAQLTLLDPLGDQIRRRGLSMATQNDRVRPYVAAAIFRTPGTWPCEVPDWESEMAFMELYGATPRRRARSS
jgi:hypothetical protein